MELQRLTHDERMLVNMELQRKGKNIVLAYFLLALFGTLGVHRFYLGRSGTAIFQLVLTIFGWMTVWFIVGFVPLITVGIWLIVDLFLIPKIIERDNKQLEREIVRDLYR